MSISNSSEVAARLLVDIRPENVKDGYGIDCLKITQIHQSLNDESSIMKSFDSGKELDDDNHEYPF